MYFKCNLHEKTAIQTCRITKNYRLIRERGRYVSSVTLFMRPAKNKRCISSVKLSPQLKKMNIKCKNLNKTS